MRVLDLGSGTGDVTFVAAELVGASGEVVGMDRSAEAVATAEARLSGIVRAVLPLMERTGVATAQEVGIETLQRRLTEELVGNRAVFAHPILLSAWGTAEPEGSRYGSSL